MNGLDYQSEMVLRPPKISNSLVVVYRVLLDYFGPQHWWPAETPFEVMVGAILTQSAAWSNVEKGIVNLKNAGALSPSALRNLPLPHLAALVHPCGYFNAKAVKLKALAEWYGLRYGDSLEKMSAADTLTLRKELLGVHGIGEETADSILLYAAGKPVFVIDAYTRRIIDRLGFAPESRKYSAYQQLFMDNLPLDARMFNEYHALLVALGKNVCRKNRPLCQQCCLNRSPGLISCRPE